MIRQTHKPRTRYAPLLLAVAALLPACGRQRPIRIGVALDPTAEEGAKLAALDLNAAGGVGGRRVELVYDAVPYDPAIETTLGRAERLADAGLSVVLSDNSSQQSLALGSVFNERGIVHLSANSTSPRIHDLGPWSFTLIPDDISNGRYLARRIHAEVPGARVAILYFNTAYGEGLRRGMDSALRALGTPVVWELPFVDLAAVPDLLALARSDGANVIAMATYWEGLQAAALALARQSVAARPRVYAGDAAVPQAPAPGTEGTRIVAFWAPGLGDTASRGFEARFRARYNRAARPVDAMNYDGVRLAAAAVAAGDGSAAAIRRYLESLGRTLPPVIGLSGSISFADRRRVGARRFIAEYRGGELRAVAVGPAPETEDR